jgi:LPXTG-motif cell wall-anchored protein
LSFVASQEPKVRKKNLFCFAMNDFGIAMLSLLIGLTIIGLIAWYLWKRKMDKDRLKYDIIEAQEDLIREDPFVYDR